MRGIIFFVLFIVCFCTLGQTSIPKGYYLFPIQPKNRNYLSGTFGEIRAEHFHMGIDIKTGGRIGIPVRATADGYIFRIKTSTTGYGKTLYVQHPNNTISVYAHLNQFKKNINKYVLKEQYKQETFTIDLFPKKNKFLVKKGSIIAYSGNTGSSAGPHLHFEIRDSIQRPMDVLKIANFSEIYDKIKPVAHKIAFVTLEKKARINGFFGRYEFNLINNNGVLRNRTPIILSGKIGVELYGYDRMNNSRNKNGIVETVFSVNDDIVFHESKEQLRFEKQRNTLVHYNYGENRSSRQKFNKLYLEDGNEQTIYKITNKGIVFDKNEILTILLKDSHLNTTKIIIKNNYSLNVPSYTPKVKFISSYGNYLHIKSLYGVALKFNEWENLKPYTSTQQWRYYIWDLREGTPHKIFLNGNTLDPYYVASIPPYQTFSYAQKEFVARFSNRSLFDTLYLKFEKTQNPITKQEFFEFKNQKEPIRSNINITLSPTQKYYEEKTSVYSIKNTEKKNIII